MFDDCVIVYHLSPLSLFDAAHHNTSHCIFWREAFVELSGSMPAKNGEKREKPAKRKRHQKLFSLGVL